MSEEKTPESEWRAFEDKPKDVEAGHQEVVPGAFSLPQEPVLQSELAAPSPPSNVLAGDVQQAMLRGVMEENARLCNEMEQVKAMFMAGPGYGAHGMR